MLRILEAFIEVEKKIELDLIIVGKMGWQFEEIQKFVSKLDMNKMINKIILRQVIFLKMKLDIYTNLHISLFFLLFMKDLGYHH